MRYASAVRETWRHTDLSNAAADPVALIRYATLAASSHNTQPWRFELQSNRIVVRPDLSRSCPQVDPHVAEGNKAQFGDPRWASGMRKWIRFNGATAVRRGDGLYGASLGIPAVPQWLGNAMMRFAVSAQRQSQKDARQIRSAAAIVVVFSEADDKRHWVEAGRSFERLALQATALDLQTAFINQPVEVAPLRTQFAAFLGLGARRPDLIVRVGRGPAGPRSLRRPVQDVLVGDYGPLVGAEKAGEAARSSTNAADVAGPP